MSRLARFRALAVAALAVAGIAWAYPSSGDEGGGLRLVGPSGAPPSVVTGRLVDESTVVLAALAVLSQGGALHDPELARLPNDLAAGYARLRASQGSVPTPLVATFAGRQTPQSFDLLVVGERKDPRGALVFLHGFGGSFVLPCAEIAEAASRAGLVTYCPAMAPTGEWASSDGEAILRSTLATVKARGIRDVWLAGLSNGGIGASRLAPKLSGSIRGLVLISGAASDARAPNVSTLVVHGRQDSMFPSSLTRAYARRTGAKLVELEGGHFTMLTHRDGALGAIGDFLVRQAR